MMVEWWVLAVPVVVVALVIWAFRSGRRAQLRAYDRETDRLVANHERETRTDPHS